MSTLTTVPLELPDANEYTDALADIMDMPVMVTEFLRGRDWAVMASRQKPENEALPPIITVVQFGDRIRAVQDENAYNRCGFDYMLRSIFAHTPAYINTVLIRGVYTYADQYQREHDCVWLYDIELDGEPMDAENVFDLFAAYSVPHVPVLSRNQTLYDWMARRSIPEAAKGLSHLAPQPRAGVVFRPVTEQMHVSVGRLWLKARAK